MTDPATNVTRVLIVLKTNEGGLWILPHVDMLLRHGHVPMVALPEGAGRLERALQERGIPVHPLPSSLADGTVPGLVRALRALRRILRQTRPDVVMYHLYASALLVRAAATGLGLRKVYMVAGPLYLEKPAIRRAEMLMANLDTLIIAGSEFTRRAYLSLPLVRTPVLALPYGVDTKRHTLADETTRQRARRRFQLPVDSFVATMVAFVYPPRRGLHGGYGIKGHHVLLRAWTSFRDQRPDARLLIVGGGFYAPGEAYRQQLMREFSVRDDASIVWVHSVEDVRDAYAAADLSVSPSLSENHGAALEAGASGVPSIVSDAGGLPESITSEAGWVVPSGSDAALLGGLESAYQEWQGRRLGARGRAARAHVEARFDSSAAAAELVAVLTRVASSRSPDSATVRRAHPFRIAARAARRVFR